MASFCPSDPMDPESRPVSGQTSFAGIEGIEARLGSGQKHLKQLARQGQEKTSMSRLLEHCKITMSVCSFVRISSEAPNSGFWMCSHWLPTTWMVWSKYYIQDFLGDSQPQTNSWYHFETQVGCQPSASVPVTEQMMHLGLQLHWQLLGSLATVVRMFWGGQGERGKLL